MSKYTHSFKYGGVDVILETGGMARQADSAVTLTMGGNVMLATLVYSKTVPDVKRDFVPFTVDFRSPGYGMNRIPGGFMKREGRPSEKEVLISRLIDRPLRPLFKKGFANDVQLIVTALSQDKEISSDIPAMLAASAAVAISGLPMHAIIGAARVGYKNGEFLLNPPRSEMLSSELDLVVAGTDSAAMMVESQADELAEQVMLDAVFFGQQEMQTAINAIKEFADLVPFEKYEWEAAARDNTTENKIAELAENKIKEAYNIADKTQRREAINNLRKEVLEDVAGTDSDIRTEAEICFAALEKNIVRRNVLEQHKRIDGRKTDEVRTITPEVSTLLRTHGSALFTRGETQALVVVTLGTDRDAQIIEDIDGEGKDIFMLHYNFPPFSVGEIGFLGSPKRREIGHGKLARRALEAVLPAPDKFPYVVRLVSEILESNGSSSMATVCGSSLALMDAGVPIKAPVAGIAMGLVKEGDNYVVLSDILGDEDHLGDMDFKVAGTSEGITALQMDIKIEGITKDIMEKALLQANKGRMHILGIMNGVLDKPRTEVSKYAPAIISFSITPDKVRDVIGKGGATIKALIEETGVKIDIEDSGLIKIASDDNSSGLLAKEKIELLTADPEVGKIYDGTVVKLMDFGAFVNILPGKDGLVHVSQIANERVENVADYLQEGQKVRVKLLEVDRQGKLRLSMKEIDAVE